jgi:methylated-DNA-[protein]-cysteine S-methyltransferase
MPSRTIDSPIGTLLLETDGKAITKLEIGSKKSVNDTSPILDRAELELAEYFSGARQSFDVPMHAEGTEFQKKVWNAMRKIPHGKTKTYGEIARAIGKAAAVRAVGAACGKNPILILNPCHRVLASNGSLGGFSAGLHRKKELLTREGLIV